MSQLVSTERSAHYYAYNNNLWEPCYEIPCTSKDGTRPPNIADARRLGLVPGVTGVLSVLSKPGLEAWKQEQAIIAALSLPRVDGEPLDAFARRVVADAETQSTKARELGTRIHAMCEQYARREKLPPWDETDAKFMESFTQWFDNEVEEVLGVETIVGDPELGYAGKLDLHCVLRGLGEAVVDVKTQAVKRNGKGKKPAFYKEWLAQLAAYGRPVNPNRWPTLVSLIIDTESPGPISCQQWPDAEEGWRVFQHCLALWQWQNAYVPNGKA